MSVRGHFQRTRIVGFVGGAAILGADDRSCGFRARQDQVETIVVDLTRSSLFFKRMIHVSGAALRVST